MSGRRIMAAATSLTPDFRAGRPEVVLEGDFDIRGFEGRGSHDVFPDGQRFLMLKSVAPNHEADALRVIVNWPELLNRRTP